MVTKHKAQKMQNTLSSSIEEQKIELIRLRIKNGFYDRDEVFNRIADEILNKKLKPKK